MKLIRPSWNHKTDINKSTLYTLVANYSQFKFLTFGHVHVIIFSLIYIFPILWIVYFNTFKISQFQIFTFYNLHIIKFLHFKISHFVIIAYSQLHIFLFSHLNTLSIDIFNSFSFWNFSIVTMSYFHNFTFSNVHKFSI